MKLILKQAPRNEKFLWLCDQKGNLKDVKASTKYGPDRKLSSHRKEEFDGKIDFERIEPVVLLLRAISNSLPPKKHNWIAVSRFLDRIVEVGTIFEDYGFSFEELFPSARFSE